MNLWRRHSGATVVDSELVGPNPEIPEALNQYAPLLDGTSMSSLDAQVDPGGMGTDTAARRFLLENDLISAE